MSALLSGYYERWAALPWRHFDTSCVARHPTFAACEAVYLCIAILGVADAASAPRGAPRRRHFLLLFASLLGGLGNDVVFSYLPVVDNFWHAQATVMLSPRFPLYILLYYVAWLYVPAAVTWRLRLRSPAAEAACCALLCCAFYAPWDIVGAKMLWWTWHDTDKTLQQRILGAPVASTMWVLVFCWCWHRILRAALGAHDAPAPGAGRAAAVVGVFGSFCATWAMLPAMVLLQCAFALSPPPAPPTTVTMLLGTAALCAAALLRGRGGAGGGAAPQPRGGTGLLRACLLAHFGFLAAVAVAGDPEGAVSPGVHQTYGPCGVEARDVNNMTRHLYVCEEEADEEYSFRCAGGAPPRAAEPAEWYTVCGTARRGGWTAGSISATAAGAACFAAAVAAGRDAAAPAARKAE